MDSFNLSEDITLMYVAASRFPEGVEHAHMQLHAMFPEKTNRRFFGISWAGDNGEIIYKAATDQIEPGEAETLGLDTFTIKKGSFHCFYIKDFMQNVASIAEAFKILLQQDDVDPKGYCLEWYIGANDVKCMVPIDDKTHFTGVNNAKF